MFTIKTIIHPPVRFVLTILGIALCVILMLFLLAIYRGVSEGFVSYIRKSKADLWILQKHNTNILRSSSLIPAGNLPAIKKINGVATATPVFFVLSSVNTAKGPATVYLTGYEPNAGFGGPADICEGTMFSSDREIVIDHAFVSKYNIHTGDDLYIKDDTLKVTGYCSGTNMFVLQYAFISLKQAHKLIGFSYFVSCFLVRLHPDADPEKVTKELQLNIADIAVFDQKTFLENNKREMKSGILPLLY